MAITNPEWAEVFEPDGGLRDIVVAGMTPNDWTKFLHHLASHRHLWTPVRDHEPTAQLPASYDEIEPEAHSLLAKGALPGQLNAWFLGDELEIDLDPREITDDSDVEILHATMRELGRLFQRDVTMSFEGSHEAIAFRYQFQDDKIRYVTPPFGDALSYSA